MDIPVTVHVAFAAIVVPLMFELAVVPLIVAVSNPNRVDTPPDVTVMVFDTSCVCVVKFVVGVGHFTAKKITNTANTVAMPKRATLFFIV